MTDRPDPGDRVSTIRNIGPAMERAFAEAGITSAAALRDMGADGAYARLVAGGHPPHFIGYYALAMGLQGRPWNDCRGAEKAALRVRFDALVASASPEGPAGIERILDDIGTGRRR
ncbi:TfoX/Sxy family protein [Roseibacterium sp. SDUM158017]|uniref:TfoX/Sxy family protein n=1 Tax=Roseicyclus salinarum TaxID=3036773 RepID=UPI0024156422|nr:TfoX/Sxy family protein [Roseibacterium sp. SDUM158017]MDG4648458.1 TfoX/Sxy family protein [Roseibacterium sp. SDUM158017]